MPLAYEVRKTLNIPQTAFGDDIAVVLVTGGRYGGSWVLRAFPMQDGKPGDAVGEIMTDPDERPSMAVDTALIWVNDACVKAGWNLAAHQDRNYEYAPEEAPYFAAALFVIDRRPAPETTIPVPLSLGAES